MPYISLLLPAALKWDALAIGILLFAAYGLFWLFNNNRLFFWCVSGALAFHLTVVGTVYSGFGGSILLTVLALTISVLILAGMAWLVLNNTLLFHSIMGSCTLMGVIIFSIWYVNMIHKDTSTVRIEIAAIATPPPPAPTATPPPLATPPPTINANQGEQDSKQKTKTVPKGVYDKKMTPPPSSPHSTPPNSHVITSTAPGPSNTSVPDDPNGKQDEVMHEVEPNPGTDVLANIKNLEPGTGQGGGDPNGSGNGIPKGWEKGKGEDNKFYFIRLRYGTGASAWGAHSNGTTQLLKYLDPYIQCESVATAMDATDLRDKYMAHGQPPTFLYLYCDYSFALSNTDVAVLKNYIAQGGFLFLDSDQSPDTVAKVRSEIQRVVPEQMERLPNDHPIYKQFLFSLKTPAHGNDLIARTNYGVSRNGHLIVFYTPGNFSFFYENHYPTSPDDAPIKDYVTATFQMGGNIIAYALNKGTPTGNTIKGADAAISGNVVQGLIHIGDDNGPSGPPDAGSVKGPKLIKTPDPHVKPGMEEPDAPKLF